MSSYQYFNPSWSMSSKYIFDITPGSHFVDLTIVLIIFSTDCEPGSKRKKLKSPVQYSCLMNLTYLEILYFGLLKRKI
jgi:hypothetical protein